MKEPAAHLDVVGSVVEALSEIGLPPVLVGGMALVVLGSRRVTRGFDFVIARPGEAPGPLVGALYDRGFELASRVDAEGEVTATIGSRRVAAARLRLDAPASAYFLAPETGLRVDLLFDVPLPAAALAGRRGGLRLPRGAPRETPEVTARSRACGRLTRERTVWPSRPAVRRKHEGRRS